MASEDDKPALAEALREGDLHELRLLVRHGIQMGVQLRNQVLTILPNHLRGFDASLVILKAALRRQPGHAHVVTSLAIAVGIS